MPDLFVSAGKGVVTRFGTGSFIGAERDPLNPKLVTVRQEAIVMIPESELRLYGRSYQKAIADGSLVKRSEAEFKAWLEKESADDKLRDEGAKKAAVATNVAPTTETLGDPLSNQLVTDRAEEPAESKRKGGR